MFSIDARIHQNCLVNLFFLIVQNEHLLFKQALIVIIESENQCNGFANKRQQIKHFYDLEKFRRRNNKD